MLAAPNIPNVQWQRVTNSLLHICYTFVTYLLYSLSPSCHHRFILFCFTCCGTRATHVYGILPSKWTYATAALFTLACYKNLCYLPSDHRQTLVTNLWTPFCSLQGILPAYLSPVYVLKIVIPISDPSGHLDAA